MNKKNLYIVAAVVYFVVVGVAFFLGLETLLFFISVPWSMVITFFGFLLIHMFSHFSFLYADVAGAMLNLLIFLKLTLFKSKETDLE